MKGSVPDIHNFTTNETPSSIVKEGVTMLIHPLKSKGQVILNRNPSADSL